MLLNRQDLPVDEGELRRFLHEQDFGQLIVPAMDGDLPIVVPAHFSYTEQPPRVELHLHSRNPAWGAVEAAGRAVFSVVSAAAYIPTYWNADPGEATEWAAPTSYYAAAQLSGTAGVIEDPDEIAALLRRQLRRHQPEGGHGDVARGTPFWRLLRAIRGLRIDVDETRVKFKFGGNRSDAHRRSVAQRLLERGGVHDVLAHEFVVRRTSTPPTADTPPGRSPAT